MKAIYLTLSVFVFAACTTKGKKYDYSRDQVGQQNTRAATTTPQPAREFEVPDVDGVQKRPLKEGAKERKECITPAGEVIQFDDPGYENCLNEVNSALRQQQLKDSILKNRK